MPPASINAGYTSVNGRLGLRQKQVIVWRDMQNKGVRLQGSVLVF